MSQENDNLQAVLKQIKDDADQHVHALDRIKQDADGETLAHLDEIEKQLWNTILEIDEMQKKTGAGATAKKIKAVMPAEFFLPVTKPNPRRTRVGNVFVD